jgi:hypothetical protein
MWHWARAQARGLSAFEQVVLIITITLVSIRIILPVWHMWNGYSIQLYPFRESAECLLRTADCQVDRSVTAIEAGSFLTLGVGIVMAGRERAKRKKSKVQ